MDPISKELLRRVETWPQEDQEKLVEVAREIEARRTGVYLLGRLTAQEFRKWHITPMVGTQPIGTSPAQKSGRSACGIASTS
jgi:hypothetical protein